MSTTRYGRRDPTAILIGENFARAIIRSGAPLDSMRAVRLTRRRPHSGRIAFTGGRLGTQAGISSSGLRGGIGSRVPPANASASTAGHTPLILCCKGSLVDAGKQLSMGEADRLRERRDWASQALP
jgi:hypothetical protein